MESTNTTAIPDVKDNKVKILIGLLIAGALLCVCIIIVILFLLNQNKPKQISCLYEGKSYSAGEGFMDKDGCNSCACSENGEVACTLKYCAPVQEPTSMPIVNSPILDDLAPLSMPECNITASVPPQTGDYLEYVDSVVYKWKDQHVPVGDLSNDILNKGALVIGQWPHYLDTNEIEGSDNPARTVGIYCGENKGYTIDSFISQYQAFLNEDAMEMWGVEYSITNLGRDDKWGQEAYKIKTTGPFELSDEDHIVFKGNTVYRITKNYSPSNAFVNDTIDAIHDNIVFN